ncbi:hypothetical protein, partial [Leptospira montravelensis]|uniref:hypothetical protein n=1 Tax=Leptospira montravelensis TaxID=2484961 RepID=UPI0014385338
TGEEILNLRSKSGKIEKIQTSYIDISMNSPEKNTEIRINFIGKRETNLKNNYNFSKLDISTNHVINLEFYENFYEIFFKSDSNSDFELLLNKYKEKIDNLYLPYKNWHNFINKYFSENNKYRENVTGQLGIAPSSIANQLINTNFHEIKISLIPIKKTSLSSGKVLTLDKYFVWSNDFEIVEK